MEHTEIDSKKRKLLLTMFLVGIFMGSLDTAIVSPARTIIGNTLNISADSSIWIITLYSLIYAVSMPIVGKFADRKGLKSIFTVSILLFGIGSLLCGISGYIGSFTFLLIARVIEAIGAGGINPIAAAFVGSTSSKGKKGSALGLTGAMTGVGTVIGPSIGSFLLNLCGDPNWGIIFFINVPIAIVVLCILISIKIPTIKVKAKKMDIIGAAIVSLFILSIMLFVTNLSFTDVIKSLESVSTYPYLIAAIVLLPILIFVELRAEDPIINVRYFAKKQMLLTYILAFLVGVGLMVVIFIPQYASNTLGLKLGSGGYFVTLMAVFSGFGAPFGGKIIDKFSVKLILVVGFLCSLIGSLILAFYVPIALNSISFTIGLVFLGLGIGFTMGTPLNYLIQSSVKREHVGSAQSTLSLVRSVGIAVSPNILINFVVEAGKQMPHKLLSVMPSVSGFNMSSTTAMTSSNMVSSFQNANVTTIFGIVKNFAKDMIVTNTSNLPQSVSNKIQSDYLTKLDASRGIIEKTYQHVMNTGFSEIFMVLAVLAFLGLIVTLILPRKINQVI